MRVLPATNGFGAWATWQYSRTASRIFFLSSAEAVIATAYCNRLSRFPTQLVVELIGLLEVLELFEAGKKSALETFEGEAARFILLVEFDDAFFQIPLRAEVGQHTGNFAELHPITAAVRLAPSRVSDFAAGNNLLDQRRDVADLIILAVHADVESLVM